MSVAGTSRRAVIFTRHRIQKLLYHNDTINQHVYSSSFHHIALSDFFLSAYSFIPSSLRLPYFSPSEKSSAVNVSSGVGLLVQLMLIGTSRATDSRAIFLYGIQTIFRKKSNFLSYRLPNHHENRLTETNSKSILLFLRREASCF